METNLKWLLAPVSEDDFADRHWAKAPLLITRKEPGYYGDLFPASEMEYVIHNAAKSQGSLEILVEDDRAQRCNSHPQAVAAFQSGKSLRVDSVQRFSQSVGRLARNLECSINSPVNVNMYLTPGDGKKALDRHYDTHDVFVVQVHGRKLWRLFGPAYAAPLEYLPLQRHESNKEMRRFRLQIDFSEKSSRELIQEFYLNPGDMLYLPRGFWHEAASEPNRISCHLTIGVQPTTYLDLISLSLSKAALSNPGLRESLPLGFAVRRQSFDVALNRVTEVAKTFADDLDPPAALSDLITSFLRINKAGFDNRLLSRNRDRNPLTLDLSSRLRVRDGVVCGIDAVTSPPRLLFESKKFAIDPRFEDACRLILSSREFIVGDLPGALSDADRLALSTQLLSEGLLDLMDRPRNSSRSRKAETAVWVPVHLDMKRKRVTWIDMKGDGFHEPFFHQTAKRFKAEHPTGRTVTTSLRKLTQAKSNTPPSGFIFHMSRSGSTLVSNCFQTRKNTIVISEAQPINATLDLMLREQLRGHENDLAGASAENLLSSLVRSYGRRSMGTEDRLVFKFSSWNILLLRAVRKLYPEVPCVVVVRNPVEVAVSCIEGPPSWMGWLDKRRRLVQLLLGGESQQMSRETFCAKMLQKFLDETNAASDAICRVVDYTSLSPAYVAEIAKFFQIKVGAEDLLAYEMCFATYSKDRTGQRKFEPESDAKQQRASEHLRDEVERWTAGAYSGLFEGAAI